MRGGVGLGSGGRCRGLPAPFCGGGSARGDGGVVHLIIVGAAGDPGAARELGAQVDGGGRRRRLVAYRGNLQELEQLGWGADSGGLHVAQAGGAGADGSPSSHRGGVLVHALWVAGQPVTNDIARLCVTVGGRVEPSQLFRSTLRVLRVQLRPLQTLIGSFCRLLVGVVPGARFGLSGSARRRRSNRVALGSSLGFRGTTGVVIQFCGAICAPFAVQTVAVPSLTLRRTLAIHVLVGVAIRAGAVAVWVMGFALELERVRGGQHGFGGHQHLAVVTEGQAGCGRVELQGVRLLHLSKDFQDVRLLLEERRQGLHGGSGSTGTRGGVLCAETISLWAQRDLCQRAHRLVETLRACGNRKCKAPWFVLQSVQVPSA